MSKIGKGTVIMRVPKELERVMKEIAEKNGISAVQAGKELATEAKNMLNGKVRKRKFIREVRF